MVSGEADSNKGFAKTTTKEKFHINLQPFNPMHNHKQEGQSILTKFHDR
jgi:hypothetical protein